jgi:diguanylate cyclase (GGDEF)-like protein/PAS domain S-box-containing protein
VNILKKRGYRVNSKIYRKSLILTLTIFVLIGTLGSAMIFSILNKVAIQLGESYLIAHTNQHQEQIAKILENGAKISNLFSVNKNILQFIQNESNLEAKNLAFKTLNEYVKLSDSDGWFIAIRDSENFYFNNSKNEFSGSELRKKLFIGNVDDIWFYLTLDSNKSYNINIDYQKSINDIKVWINHKIVDSNGRVIAIFGSAFDYEKFWKDFLDEEDKKLKTFTILKNGDIIAHKNISIINEDVEFLSQNEDKKNIFQFFTNRDFKYQLETEISKLNSQKTINFISKLNKNDKYENIISVSLLSLSNVEWYMFSAINLGSIIDEYNKLLIVSIFIFIFITTFIINLIFIKSQFLKPIHELYDVIHAIRNGELTKRVANFKDREDEVGSLILEFNNMADIVEKYKEHSSKLYTLLTENMADVIWMMDKHGNILYISPSIEYLTGYTQIEAMLQKIEDRYSSESVSIILEHMLNAIQYHEIPILKLQQIRKNGSLIWVELNLKIKIDEVEGIRFIGSTRDISNRLEMEKQVERLLFIDSLTGLVNRKFLMNRIKHHLYNFQLNGGFGALIDINIDEFKHINEAYSFNVGDSLLIDISKRLKDSVRESDSIARIGGDEFLILVEYLGKDSKIAPEIGYLIAEKIKFFIQEPYKLENGDTVYLTCSVGIKIFNANSNIEEILKDANLAMFQSKHNGKNLITLWETI